MVLNRQRRVRVRRQALEDFLARVRRKVGAGRGSVSVCLLSDAAISRLNRSYRGKSGPTDVLSFPAGGRNGNGNRRGPSKERLPASFMIAERSSSFLGDIAISVETARRNARRFGRDLEDELRILILHGVLHLMGYDHETDEGQMERLELRLRRELKVAGK